MTPLLLAASLIGCATRSPSILRGGGDASISDVQAIPDLGDAMEGWETAPWRFEDCVMAEGFELGPRSNAWVMTCRGDLVSLFEVPRGEEGWPTAVESYLDSFARSAGVELERGGGAVRVRGRDLPAHRGGNGAIDGLLVPAVAGDVVRVAGCHHRSVDPKGEERCGPRLEALLLGGLPAGLSPEDDGPRLVGRAIRVPEGCVTSPTEDPTVGSMRCVDGSRFAWVELGPPPPETFIQETFEMETSRIQDGAAEGVVFELEVRELSCRVEGNPGHCQLTVATDVAGERPPLGFLVALGSVQGVGLELHCLMPDPNGALPESCAHAIRLEL